jgi:hypothetical protein
MTSETFDIGDLRWEEVSQSDLELRKPYQNWEEMKSEFQGFFFTDRVFDSEGEIGIILIKTRKKVNLMNSAYFLGSLPPRKFKDSLEGEALKAGVAWLGI